VSKTRIKRVKSPARGAPPDVNHGSGPELFEAGLDEDALVRALALAADLSRRRTLKP
jgi:hypothetical protein